jgi:hypothetical protein
MVNIRHILVHMRAGHWSDAKALLHNDHSMLGAWLQGILHLHDGDVVQAEAWYAKANRSFKSHSTVEDELKRFESEMLD